MRARDQEQYDKGSNEREIFQCPMNHLKKFKKPYYWIIFERWVSIYKKYGTKSISGVTA